VQAFAPELSAWLRRVFTVMGGFMSAGVGALLLDRRSNERT
jgi:hypothetical protein